MGVYLLLFVPHSIDGLPGSEPLAKQRNSAALGLLLATNSPNLAHTKVYEGVVSLGTNQVEITSDVFVNPLASPEPDLREPHLNLMTKVAHTLEGLSEVDQSRIELSLRWFEQASYAWGVDSYLKFWIALETLTMDTSDIKPLRNILSQAYGITPSEASNRFQVGRLFSLRNQIVHQGAIVPVHSSVLDYIGAVYVDCLFHVLGLDSPGKASSVLDAGEFDVSMLRGLS